MGEIVFVEVLSIGKDFNKGEVLGSVEAVKTIIDSYMTVFAQIFGVNPTLKHSPTLINQSPESEGGIIKVNSTDPPNASTYNALIL